MSKPPSGEMLPEDRTASAGVKGEKSISQSSRLPKGNQA